MRPLFRILRATLIAFVVLNAVVFWHTWRMTHFVPPESVERSSEKLSALGQVARLFRGIQIPKSIVAFPAPQFSGPAKTVSFITRDGVKLEAWDIPAEGARGVVVAFHGYVGSRSGMIGEARVLHELGWRVLLVDLRASGGSDGYVSTFGWREARDVAAAAGWVRREWPGATLILYGKSMGAAAVMRAMVTENVQADGLILECPFDKLVTMIGGYYKGLGLTAFPLAQLSLVWGGVQLGFNPFRHNPVVYASEITCPTLLLDGMRDPYVKLAETRHIAAALRGPVTCRIFESGGHGDYAKHVPQEYHDALAEWFATIAPSQKIDSEK